MIDRDIDIKSSEIPNDMSNSKAVLLEDLISFRTKINKILNSLLLQNNVTNSFGSKKILDAMRYSTLANNSSRIRPYLLYHLVCYLTNVEKMQNAKYRRVIYRIVAAVEMVHSYSLVHDDLPDLDNDDYRRGQASCHKKFGNAYAILAGNALLTLAFQTVAKQSYSEITAEQHLNIIKTMAEYSGYCGMIGGQAQDLMHSVKNSVSFKKIGNKVQIQYDLHLLMKTTALFQMLCKIASIICKVSMKQEEGLLSYGMFFGQLYQIIDDLKDEPNISKQLQTLFEMECRELIKKMQNVLSNIQDNQNNHQDIDKKNDVHCRILHFLPEYIFLSHNSRIL